MVYQLSKKEIWDIVKNWKFSKHAQIRIVERTKSVNIHEAENTLITNVFKQNFGYMNTDGCINLAVTDHTYLVIAPREVDYLVITYKEKSHNGYTVKDKYELALKGVER